MAIDIQITNPTPGIINIYDAGADKTINRDVAVNEIYIDYVVHPVDAQSQVIIKNLATNNDICSFQFGNVSDPVAANFAALQAAIRPLLFAGGGPDIITAIDDLLTGVNGTNAMLTSIAGRMDTEILFSKPLRIDEASATVTYLGYAPVGQTTNTAGSVWAICRITVTGTETITEWVDGDLDFNKVWDDRVAAVY